MKWCPYCRASYSQKCTRQMHHAKRVRIPGWGAVSICTHFLFHWLRWMAIEMGQGFTGAG